MRRPTQSLMNEPPPPLGRTGANAARPPEPVPIIVQPEPRSEHQIAVHCCHVWPGPASQSPRDGGPGCCQFWGEGARVAKNALKMLTTRVHKSLSLSAQHSQHALANKKQDQPTYAIFDFFSRTRCPPLARQADGHERRRRAAF